MQILVLFVSAILRPGHAKGLIEDDPVAIVSPVSLQRFQPLPFLVFDSPQSNFLPRIVHDFDIKIVSKPASFG